MAGIIFLTASALVALATISVWKRRQATGGMVLFLLMTAILIWVCSAAGESLSIDLATKLIWAKAEYLGSVSTGPLFLIFALIYTHRGRMVTWRNVILLSITPILIFLLALTNESHRLIWSGFTRIEYPASVLYIYQHGRLYWVNPSYAFACVLAAAVMLWQEYLRASHVYRRQYIAFLVAALIPFISSLLYVLGFNPMPGLDLAALSFAGAGIFIAYGTQAYGLMDLVPIARHTLVEHLVDGVVVLDLRNRILDVNQTILDLFGFPSAPVGENVFSAFQKEPLLASTLLQKPPDPVEVALSGSTLRYLEVRVTPVIREYGQIVGYVAVLRDITDRKKVEAALEENRLRLERMTVTDDLTSLFNRRYVDQIIEREFRRSERYRIHLSVAMFDVDDFKGINDTHGHSCGDDALRAIARAIVTNIRTTDIPARMGGDEFLIIFPHTSVHDAWAIMERLRKALSDINVECSKQAISISGGVLEWKNGRDAAEVLRSADRLLYEAKRLGKGRILKEENP